MIITPHLAGDRVRVHLSNRFGTTPITLGPVTVALRDSGAALAPGTRRRVRFDGAGSVTIPAGGSVVSDPVALKVKAFSDVAVSVDVPGTIEHPTEHFITRQTNYLSPAGSGDETSTVSGAAFPERTALDGYSTGWYFLDGLDVRAPATTSVVVAFGDSLTDGFQAQAGGGEALGDLGRNLRWPDDLQRRIDDAHLDGSVVDAGISGNRLLSGPYVPMFGPSGLSRFRTDALSVPGVTDVIVFEGINDLGSNASLTAAQVIAGEKRLVSAAHAAGVRIQLGTITPAEGATQLVYGTPATNRRRETVNRWIRSQKLSDGIVDFAAAVRDPDDPARLAPAYDDSDHLHCTPAGYRAMAQAVKLPLLDLG